MAEADPKISETRVSVAELRANLSRYLKKVEDGASFLIVSRGKSVAVLRPEEKPADPLLRQPGAMKGQFTISDDFDTLPEDVIESFYSSKLFGDT